MNFKKTKLTTLTVLLLVCLSITGTAKINASELTAQAPQPEIQSNQTSTLPTMSASTLGPNVADPFAEITPVAELSIYISTASISGSSPYGHAWLYVFNWSKKPYTVGSRTIAPNTGITVGTFPDEKHTGVWYNQESSDVKYKTNISYTQELSANQMGRLNSFVVSNNTWSVGNNCTHFAANGWNHVFGTSTFSGGLPAVVMAQIALKPGHVYHKPFPVSGGITHD